MAVNYDFGAADLLVWALSTAENKTSTMIGVRKTGRSTLLGDAPGDNWQGKHRNEFDKDFARQQKALMALADDLRSALRQLNRATDRAQEINKKKPQGE
jgi:uncharacterized protein YukE